MAVTPDTRNGLYSPNTDTHEFPLDVSGNYLLLALGGYVYPGGAQPTISSVKFNDVSMTKLYEYALGGTTGGLFVYELVNPDNGSYSVSVITSSNCYLILCASSYSSVDQTTPILDNGTVNGTSGKSSSISGLTEGFIYAVNFKPNDENVTPGSGQIVEYNDKHSGINRQLTVTYEDSDTGASFSWPTSSKFRGLALVLNPLSQTGPSGVKTINGVSDWKTFNGVAKEDAKSLNGITFDLGSWRWLNKGGIWLPKNPGLVTA